MKKTVISIIGITIMLFAFTACRPSVGETAQEIIKSAWNAVEHAEGTDLGTEAIVKDSNGDKYLSVLVSEGVFKDVTVYKDFTIGDKEFKVGKLCAKDDGWYNESDELVCTNFPFSDLGDNFSLEGFGKKLYQNIIIDVVTIPEIIRRQQDGYGEEISSVITYEFTTPYKDITSIEFDDGNIYRIIGGKYAGEYSGFSVGE